MAGPANLHQIRFLVSGLSGEAEEGIVGRPWVNEVADEVAMQRKEAMSRTVGRAEGHACGVVLGHVGGLRLGAGGPLNNHLTRSGTSGEELATQSRGKSECVQEEARAVEEASGHGCRDRGVSDVE